MIKPHCFQKEWIDGFRAQEPYSKINPPLLEKMIHALSLLQYLQTHGLNFIFKGGTSLILLLKNANRFSVDIDIITEDSRETIENILDRVVSASHFKGCSNYVLLDILFEKSPYPNIQRLPIQSVWIETEAIIEIYLPTIEAITGDKLTAFAPTTTGILYGKGKELEIIKQLFDLANLFNQIQSLEKVAASFSAFAAKEIFYRKLDIQTVNILMDSIDTCRIISFRERNRHEPEKSRFTGLQNGIRSFSNYLISEHFRIDEAVTASSKVAYLCAKLLKSDFDPIEKYENQDVKALEIVNQQWNGLNRLKRFPDQSAFFYWYKCLEILDQTNG
jgi:hypothetical protein